jgi:transcriptional regulator with XRE-family HTH domain
MYNVYMRLSELITEAQLKFWATKGQKLTQAKMAEIIGVKSRTYVEYLRGTNEPMAMKALLNLLTLLPDEEITKLLKAWREAKEEK